MKIKKLFSSPNSFHDSINLNRYQNSSKKRIDSIESH